MHDNDFPPDTPEHLAQAALNGGGAGYRAASDLLIGALKVLQLWERVAPLPDTGAANDA